MTVASFFLGILIATTPACLLILFLGGNFRRLVAVSLFSWSGFWLGHLLAAWRGWHFFLLGPINLGTAILFSILFSFLGFWLCNFQPAKNK
jgi:hypothetical protein